MKILYLEDDPANLALIERVCQMHGDELFTVQHPQVALEMIAEEPYHLIITDIELGQDVMDGLDFVAYLREHGLDTPIVSITAYDFDEYSKRSEEAGTNFHIVKPVAVQALIDLFDRFR